MDKIKLAERRQVEAEVRGVCVRYVKDGEGGWTPVVRRMRERQVAEVGVVLVVVIWTWVEGNGWSIDASGSLEFIFTGKSQIEAAICYEAQPHFFKN